MPPAPVTPTKGHYVILDGLRGVASLMVVIFHLLEAHAGGSHQDQIINHGYLAVDFFFMLSGFVIAYAYDDRWAHMGTWEFYKRRLIRLQPMIIAGSVIGAALFFFQDSPLFAKHGSATVSLVIVTMLLGFIMIPLPPAMELRGWQEIYPLNGPQWSLFYEYIANILYAAGLRRLSNRALAVFVGLAAVPLVHLAVFGPHGDLIGGWALDADGVRIGLSRVLFPFFAGVLLQRLGARVKVRHGFAASSLLLLVALSLPRFGGSEAPWLNGLYEALCVILVFPLIVAIGAGEQDVDGRSVRIARFFGALSYPLYITHYPLIYIYTAWVVDRHVTVTAAAPVAAGVLVTSIAIAWACLKLYDEPVRRWLARRLPAASARAEPATGD